MICLRHSNECGYPFSINARRSLMIKNILFILSLWACLFVTSKSLAQSKQFHLRAGAAAVNITPPVGICHFG